MAAMNSSPSCKGGAENDDDDGDDEETMVNIHS